jgi:hypothetical protein
MVTLSEPGTRAVRCVDSSERPVPGFDVEVVAVEARLEPTVALVRGEVRSARVRVQTRVPRGADPLPLPDRILARPSDGVQTTRVVREGDVLELGLWTDPDAPDRASIDLGVLAGTGLVVLASVTLPVRDPGPIPDPVRAAPAAPEQPDAVDPFAALLLPGVPALDDPTVRGVRSFIGASVLDAPGEVEQVRVSTGARAQVFDEPLRLGLAWVVDATDTPDVYERTGDADLRVDGAFAFRWSSGFEQAVDVEAWLPTGASPDGLDAARFSIGLYNAWRVDPRVALRAEAGGGFGLEGAPGGLHLAAGADLRLFPSLTAALEVDAGSFVAAGLGLAARVGPLELVAGGRLGLGDAAETRVGAWSATATIRLSTGL